MFKKLLVTTDGSEVANRAVLAAIDFARSSGGSIVGLCVAEQIDVYAMVDGCVGLDIVAMEKEIMANAQKNVAFIAEEAAKSGVRCEVHVVKGINPYQEIVKCASQYQCDAIFMASHGRKGLDKLLLGSQTQKVLAHSDMPVIVYR